MRGRRFYAWLLALSDPRGARALPPRALPMGRWADLCDLADCHGVLPAVSANAKRALAAHGAARIVTGTDAERVMNGVLSEARRRLVARTAQTLAIRGQSKEIAVAFGDAALRVAVLKGADFADCLYPAPSLRCFTDLDLLVPRDEVEPAESALRKLGYVPCDAALKYESAYGERSWRRPDRPEATIEIHWNLVNSPALRGGVGLAWEDLALAPDPESRGQMWRPTASSRLLIAAVHAAASHGFDRLQPLYDVALASRGAGGALDIAWLSDTTRRTGATLALAVSLSLGARLLGERACSNLAREMHLPQWGLWAILLDRGVVLRGHCPWDSFRRQLFREMLKRR
ncbi:MAG: nucleotidyltransferase family protein [Sedimentisphaerales bacterium]|nr:nucleotidyltransferase family protein [Sedimentisphaerales bacterium]